MAWYEQISMQVQIMQLIIQITSLKDFIISKCIQDAAGLVTQLGLKEYFSTRSNIHLSVLLEI